MKLLDERLIELNMMKARNDSNAGAYVFGRSTSVVDFLRGLIEIKNDETVMPATLSGVELEWNIGILLAEELDFFGMETVCHIVAKDSNGDMGAEVFEHE